MGKKNDSSARPNIARVLDHLFRYSRDASGALISVEKFAELQGENGPSATYLYALRSGAKRNPTIATLQTLADFFNVPIHVFFQDPETIEVPLRPTPGDEASFDDSQAAIPDDSEGQAIANGEEFLENGSMEGGAPTPPPMVGRVDLAERLQHLFALRLRPDGTTWTLRQVNRAAKAQGVALSVTFLQDLRQGRRDNPTKQQLECLARIFDVRPGFFFEDDEKFMEVSEERRAQGALADERFAAFALRSKGLDDKDYRKLNAFLDEVLGKGSS